MPGCLSGQGRFGGHHPSHPRQRATSPPLTEPASRPGSLPAPTAPVPESVGPYSPASFRLFSPAPPLEPTHAVPPRSVPLADARPLHRRARLGAAPCRPHAEIGTKLGRLALETGQDISCLMAYALEFQPQMAALPCSVRWCHNVTALYCLYCLYLLPSLTPAIPWPVSVPEASGWMALPNGAVPGRPEAPSSPL